jgi:hypothetical protein
MTGDATQDPRLPHSSELEDQQAVPRIFCGASSTAFWSELDGLRDKGTVTGMELWAILYSLGCKLQQLESRVEPLGCDHCRGCDEEG